MSLDINQVVPVVVNIGGASLSPTNLGVAMVFYANAIDSTELGANFFTSAKDVREKFPDKKQLIECADAWFRKANSLITFGYTEAPVSVKKVKQNKTPVELDKVDTPKSILEDKLSMLHLSKAPVSFLDALNYAAQKYWFYTPFLTEYKEDLSGEKLVDIAKWCESNTRFLFWPTEGTKASDPSVTTDDASVLSVAQNRRCAVISSNVSFTSAIRAASELAIVDYSSENGYKDLEFKNIGLAPDDFSSSQIATLKAKGAMFNVEVASKGSKTGSMLINTVSTSPYNELVSEVIAIDNYALSLQTSLFNIVSGSLNFPQTPEGQLLLIDVANKHGETAIYNGFLGENSYFDIKKDKNIITRGYETLTAPEDIYKLSPEQKKEHLAAPINQDLFLAGSVHKVALTINVK